MNRRFIPRALWSFTTAVTTAVCWAGVSVVTPSITASHSPALPPREVHAAAHSPTTTSGLLPTASTAPNNVDQPVGVPAPARSGVNPLAHAGGSAPPPAPSSATGGDAPFPVPSPPSPDYTPPPPHSPPAAASPPVISGPAPPASSGGATGTGSHDVGGSEPPPPAPSPPPPSPPPPSGGGSSVDSAPVPATFFTIGGTVTVACLGSTISLVSASPAQGYALAVHNAGPNAVDVAFDGQTQSSFVHAFCLNGRPARDE